MFGDAVVGGGGGAEEAWEWRGRGVKGEEEMDKTTNNESHCRMHPLEGLRVHLFPRDVACAL